MPRYQPNPTAVTAGLPIFPAGEYEIILGEPSSFHAPGKNGKEDNFGVRFKGVVAEGEQKGKPFMFNFYMHTEPSQSYSKQIQMAVLGFSKNQEAEFNAKAENMDWSFDTDNKSAGEAWNEMTGKRVLVNVDVGMDADGNQQQKVKGYRPLV